MPDPEIRELRYFRAVAEDLNITRAAERLGIAQPPLSRAMRQLERRVGVALFDRSAQRLRLTPAGETFLEEAAQVLDALDTAVRRTRRAAAVPSRTLLVTAKPGVATALLHRVVARFREQPDALAIHFEVSGFGEQAAMVRDGRVDLALVSKPFDSTGLQSELLVTEPRVAALPVGHPLTALDLLHTEDLAGIPAPRWSGATGTDQNFWSARPDDPADGPVVHDVSQLLEVIAFGQAVALVPRSLSEHHRRPDITYRPVADAHPYETSAVWQPSTTTPGIPQFLAAARACVSAQRSAVDEPAAATSTG